jgi:hypothetical protein
MVLRRLIRPRDKISRYNVMDIQRRETDANT